MDNTGENWEAMEGKQNRVVALAKGRCTFIHNHAPMKHRIYRCLFFSLTQFFRLMYLYNPTENFQTNALFLYPLKASENFWWRLRKTSGFLTFSAGTKTEHWSEVGWVKKNYKNEIYQNSCVLPLFFRLINPLSANPTICLSVFDHFVGLALEGLNQSRLANDFRFLISTVDFCLIRFIW